MKNGKGEGSALQMAPIYTAAYKEQKVTIPDHCIKEPVASNSVTEDSASHSVSLQALPENNPDFATIRLVSQVVLFILKKCWMTCGAAVCVIFVIYWYYGGFLATCLFVFGITGLLYQLGDWLLFHPDQPAHARLYVPSPSMFGLPADNLHIKSKDGTQINIVLVKQKPSVVSQVPTILFLHGNAGNIGHRLPNVRGLYHMCECNILLVEYRGYGHSEGSPNEEGLYQDAQAALEFIVNHPSLDSSKIIVFGRSLGGAVAIDLASHPEYNKRILLLIVENTFTSIPDIAGVLFKWRLIQSLPTCFFKNQFKSLEKISKVTVPTLFISGMADMLIPPNMMYHLYEGCGSSMKRLITFESGTHNETWQCSGYYRALVLFINDVMLAYYEKQQTTQWPTQAVCIHIPADIVW